MIDLRGMEGGAGGDRPITFFTQFFPKFTSVFSGGTLYKSIHKGKITVLDRSPSKQKYLHRQIYYELVSIENHPG